MSELPISDGLEGFPHPRETRAVIGHHEAEQEFLNSFNSGRFHHAWLITGLKGIGKSSFAYRAARFLLSQDGNGGGLFGPPDSLDTPQDHPLEALLQAGSHPQLSVLRRRYDDKGKKLFKVIRIDDVRSLSSFFGLKPEGGGWRVVIVDSIDDMNIAAANAFLKILEEPPEQTVFLMLSHRPAGLLPTIRSRCRMLPLQPLEKEKVRDVLSPYADTISPEQMEILVTLSEGSPGKALLLQQAGGAEVFLSILQLFQSYPNFDPAKLHGLADNAAKKDGEALYRVLTELFPWWLSRLVRTVSTQFQQTECLPDEQACMARLINHRPVAFWVDIWEKSNHLVERADSINLDKKQVVLDLFLSTTR